MSRFWLAGLVFQDFYNVSAIVVCAFKNLKITLIKHSKANFHNQSLNLAFFKEQSQRKTHARYHYNACRAA